MDCSNEWRSIELMHRRRRRERCGGHVVGFKACARLCASVENPNVHFGARALYLAAGEISVEFLYPID